MTEKKSDRWHQSSKLQNIRFEHFVYVFCSSDDVVFFKKKMKFKCFGFIYVARI